MAIWKVTQTSTTETGEPATVTRLVRADRRKQVESYLLQAFAIDNLRSAEALAELRDVEIEEIE